LVVPKFFEHGFFVTLLETINIESYNNTSFENLLSIPNEPDIQIITTNQLNKKSKEHPLKQAKTAREIGLSLGNLSPGPRNLITDVPGVTVGHTTLNNGNVCTGVTAILPHAGNTFKEKLPAAAHVINGFGKSMGLIQIDELGTLETPIILTNTLSIGTAANALVSYMLEKNPEIGTTTGTVNPVVGECNDGFLNDIRGMHVRRKHVRQAIENAKDTFAQGNVGAGTGMCAYELKGGIGSASRVISVGETAYTLGILVLTNMGKMRDLRVSGKPIGPAIVRRVAGQKYPVPDGSVIVILATDLPLCERQLRRVARRAIVGLSHTGSQIDSGSGEIVIAFSTANRIPHENKNPVIPFDRLHEERLNQVFRAVSQCTEEAVLNSMLLATETMGIRGHVVYSLTDYLDELLLH